MFDLTSKTCKTTAVQLTWGTWCEICDFIKDNRFFGGGVFLDNNSKLPLPEGKTSNTIGLWINTPAGKLLCKQDDYVVLLPDGSYGVYTQHLMDLMWNKKARLINNLAKPQNLNTFPYKA